MVKKVIPLLIICIFSFLSSYSLLHRGLPPTHDGEYHIVRFYEFDKVLRSGVIYPRWAPDLNAGFGLPLFNYVYPLPNYIASFFHIFGFSFIDSFKVSMILATFIGGIFFYYWTKEIWGILGGVVSGVFYLYSPYRFVDIYIRGSIGEVWALAFFPLFLWAITSYGKKQTSVMFFLSVISFSLVIFSHNILALMFAVFALSYAVLLCLLRSGEERILLIKRFFVIFSLSIGIASIFWLPALVETKYVQGLQVFDLKSNFPELFQLIIPTWGSGFSGGGLENQMSFQIGLANLFMVFINILLLGVFFKKWNKSQRIIIIFSLLWFLIVFALMLPFSLPIWENVPLLYYFQFPWRLLSLEIILCSFISGSLFSLGKTFKKNMFFYITSGAILILIAFSASVGYAKPAYFLNRTDNYYVTRSNFIDGTNSPGNVFNTIWVTDTFTKKKNVFEASSPIQISHEKRLPTYYQSNVSAIKLTTITANITYFPGWGISIDGNNRQAKPNKYGTISMEIPSGNHKVVLKMNNTSIQNLATILTLISIVITLYITSKKNFLGILI